jgi:hypothetical protein
MSQMRALRLKLRAIAAVAAICALIFSLLVAGAHRPRHDASHKTAQDAAICHDLGRHLDAIGSWTPTKDKHSDRAECPYCCLASLAGSAVLPGRIATLARPIRAASIISYYAFSALEPETIVASAVNGARAPPSQS